MNEGATAREGGVDRNGGTSNLTSPSIVKRAPLTVGCNNYIPGIVIAGSFVAWKTYHTPCGSKGTESGEHMVGWQEAAWAMCLSMLTSLGASITRLPWWPWYINKGCNVVDLTSKNNPSPHVLAMAVGRRPGLSLQNETVRGVRDSQPRNKPCTRSIQWRWNTYPTLIQTSGKNRTYSGLVSKST